jgi:hypothetical protein
MVISNLYTQRPLNHNAITFLSFMQGDTKIFRVSRSSLCSRVLEMRNARGEAATNPSIKPRLPTHFYLYTSARRLLSTLVDLPTLTLATAYGAVRSPRFHFSKSPRARCTLENQVDNAFRYSRVSLLSTSLLRCCKTH